MWQSGRGRTGQHRSRFPASAAEFACNDVPCFSPPDPSAPRGWPSSWSSRIPKAGKPFGTAGVGAWPSGGLSFVPSSRVVISPGLRVAPALTRRRTRPDPTHSPVGLRFCLAASRPQRPLSVQGHDAQHYGADLWKPAPLEAGPSADVTPKSRVRAGVGVRVPRGPSGLWPPCRGRPARWQEPSQGEAWTAARDHADPGHGSVRAPQQAPLGGEMGLERRKAWGGLCRLSCGAATPSAHRAVAQVQPGHGSTWWTPASMSRGCVAARWRRAEGRLQR